MKKVTNKTLVSKFGENYVELIVFKKKKYMPELSLLSTQLAIEEWKSESDFKYLFGTKEK